MENKEGNIPELYRNHSLFLNAVKNKDVNAARALLQSGMSPDSMFANGRTALQFACKEGDLPMIRLLLDNNVDLNSQGEQGIFDYPTISLVFDKLFRNRGNNASNKQELFEVFELMVKVGANVDVSPCGYGGITLLETLCTWNDSNFDSNSTVYQIKALELLLDAPNFSKKKQNLNKGNKSSLLNSSIRTKKSEQFIQRLLEAFDSFAPDDDCVAAAIKFNYNDDIIRKLLEKHANPNAQFSENNFRRSPNDSAKQTALDLARQSNRTSTIELLMQFAAKQ